MAALTGITYESIHERFWSKVDKSGPDDCWEWRGTRNPRGYGVFQRGRGIGTTLSHRQAWLFSLGEITDCILHHCDNPSCCNPAHLFDGNRDTNNKDMAAKGRSARGTRRPGVRLSESQVIEIRATHPKDVSWSNCKAAAKKYGVDIGTVAAVAHRKSWGWL
jgi:hypothetical protein